VKGISVNMINSDFLFNKEFLFESIVRRSLNRKLILYNKFPSVGKRGRRCEIDFFSFEFWNID